MRGDTTSETARLLDSLARYGPVLVLAALCLWGYLDLKKELAGLTGPGAERGLSGSSEEAVDDTRSAQRGVPAPPLAPETKEPWTCTGSIPQEKVQEAVGKNGQSVFDCYRKALGSSPDLKGLLDLEMKVGSQGTVEEARIKGKLSDPILLSCISDSVYSWQFAPPEGGECTIVSVPFMLRPEDHLEGASPTPASPPVP
jgi:hypothetical protein